VCGNALIRRLLADMMQACGTWEGTGNDLFVITDPDSVI
jgi:hypothetical protein